MSVSPERIMSALSGVTDPDTQKKLNITAKNTEIKIENDGATITVPLGYPLHNGLAELRKRVETAVSALNVVPVSVDFKAEIVAHAVQRGLKPMSNVRNIIAVASGKGGVGKSTTAVNLALALLAQGARVGLLDADIYGPSVPLMLGLSGKPETLDGKTMEPMMGHGLQANSIGFLIEDDAPAIWRGPMVTQALQQLLTQTNWKNLDYLIVDMPPGTGDIALTMAQKVPLTGAVIVTTPQDMALADARKATRMFQKVEVPVLGVVENMSVHICSQCGHAEPIFGEHGGRDMALEFDVPWLGALPLQLSIREQTDAGTPTVAAEPDSETARLYHHIAHGVAARVAALPRDMSVKVPLVVTRTD